MFVFLFVCVSFFLSVCLPWFSDSFIGYYYPMPIISVIKMYYVGRLTKCIIICIVYYAISVAPYDP